MKDLALRTVADCQQTKRRLEEILAKIGNINAWPMCLKQDAWFLTDRLERTIDFVQRWQENLETLDKQQQSMFAEGEK